jgi:hypothetical protein
MGQPCEFQVAEQAHRAELRRQRSPPEDVQALARALHANAGVATLSADRLFNALDTDGDGVRGVLPEGSRSPIRLR